MKKNLIPSIALLFCSFWLTSCNSPQNNAAKEAQPNSSPATATSNTEAAKTEATPPTATNTPAIPGNTPGNTNLVLPTPGSIPVTPTQPSLPQPITANTPINLDPSLTSAINTPTGTESTTSKTATKNSVKTKNTRKTATGTGITTEDPTKTGIGSTITIEDPTKTAIGSPITTADLTKSPTSTVKRNPAAPETRASRTTRTPTRTTARTPTRTTNTSIAARTDTVRRTTSGAQPKVATIKRMVSGDLMCYVTLVDERGREQEVGATFDICNQQTAFLNRKVRLSYQTLSVNDCQSAEPCGKTRKESLISKIELDGDRLATRLNTDSQTISNGRWRITIGNINSWTGVNGTGNLTYRGCDTRGKCIDLSGGTVACRDGICSTGWTNGDFSYILQQRMSEGGAVSPSTLVVRKGDDVVQTATGLRVVR